MTSEQPDTRPRVLDPALEEALRTGPFHTALQLAIAASGLTLERLEYRLKQRQHQVGRSTLSYWQQGRRNPERAASLRALTALEEILGVPETSLSSLLGPHKPRGRWIGYQGQALDWADVWTESDDVRRLTVIDSRRATERSQDVSITERIVMGRDLRYAAFEFQIVVKARQPNADRILMLFAADPGTDVARIGVTATEGCRVGRRRAETKERLLAFEVLYNRGLIGEQTHFFAFGMDFTDAYIPGEEVVPVVELGRVFRRPVPNYILRARFDPEALPVRCQHTRATRIGSSEQLVEELLVATEGTTHIAVQNVRPGVHRMRIEWE